ncbi:fibronectin type III domain-containing protein [Streptomyces misionensis]
MSAAAAVWAAVRPTRNRATGYVAVTAICALIGTSVAVGVGASGALPHLADIGAWLSSSKGEVAHADGLTGQVDGKAELPGTAGHPVSISQDGKTVLVLDEKTGKVIRVDPSQLGAEQSSDYGTTGLQLVAGGSYAYVVNPVKGTVQRIDPVMTTPVGAPVALGTRLGSAAVDPKGTLWVPVPGNGTVVPFVDGARSAAVKVAAPRHDLVLTLADGTPVVTDRTAAVAKVLSAAGTQQSFNLQGGIAGSAPADILVPASTDGSTVPVLAGDSGALALIDIRTGQALNAKVPTAGHRLGTPQVLGKRVYIPDESAGALLVYDTAASAFDDSVRVTGRPGALELFVRNGLLWVNDQDSASAAVINPSGQVRHIGKYKTQVPTARRKHAKPVVDDVPSAPPASQAAPPSVPTTAPEHSGPATGDRPRAPSGPRPSKTTHAPVRDCAVKWETGCPVPKAPGTPQAQSGAGSITITFAAASGVTPEQYVLKGAPAGATVIPSAVGPDGPFTFEVRGGSCAQEYSFTVVARYAAGGGEKESATSAPVRPCVSPGAPRSLRVTAAPGGHGGTLTWQAPVGSGASVTYTVRGPSGTVTTRQTSQKYTGLTNGRTYAVSVTATNAAGSGTTVGGTLDLTPPDQRMKIVHNDNDTIDLGIRNVPTSKSGHRNGAIPGMKSPTVTVHCKTTGSSETHPYDHVTSNVWAKITSSYGSGYIADIYLDSRNNPAVWQCT